MKTTTLIRDVLVGHYIDCSDPQNEAEFILARVVPNTTSKKGVVFIDMFLAGSQIVEVPENLPVVDLGEDIPDRFKDPEV